MSYVINLEHRKDRLNNFIKNYELYGPRLPLQTIKAHFDISNRVLSSKKSHIAAWKELVNSNNEYGIIYEDDSLFRNDGYIKRNWNSLNKQFIDFFKKNPEKLIMCGIGEILPIHVEIPSPSLAAAVEKSHVSSYIKDIGKLKSKEELKMNPYYSNIFKIFGTFTYVISKIYAKKLLENENDIYNESFSIINDTVTVPLHMYHDFDISLSDIRNISIEYIDQDLKDLKDLENKDLHDLHKIFVEIKQESDKKTRSLESLTDNLSSSGVKLSFIENDWKIKIIWDIEYVMPIDNWDIILIDLVYNFMNVTKMTEQVIVEFGRYESKMYNSKYSSIFRSIILMKI